MANLILCYHEQDSSYAEPLCEAIESHGHEVVVDSHPNKDALWDGGWANNSSSTDVVVILLSEAFCNHLDESTGSAFHNSVQNQVAQHEPGVAILPVVIDKVDYPEIFIGNTALFMPSQTPKLLGKKVHDYAVHMLAQTNRDFFSRIRVTSLSLLVLSMLFFVLMNIDSLIDYSFVVSPLFMMTLGALAASSHLLFNITGLLLEDNFHAGRTEENYLRIVLGSIMGWLSYVILINTSYMEDDNFLAIAMVTTFLVGFSSKLVIAIINQGIGAVERGLRLDKETETPTPRSTQS